MSLSDEIWNDGQEHCKDMYYADDVKQAVKELKEEIKRGVKRNNIYPMDWCMDSIDKIFGEKLI